MSNVSFSLEQKIALITGSARGLGFEIAKAMARAGAFVYLNGRNAQSVAKAVGAVVAAGGKAEALPFDVTDEGDAAAAIGKIREANGGLDILVNNVGQRARQPFETFSKDDMRALLETDLIAALHLSREAVGLMKARGAGRIINITSIAGQIARAEDVVYTSAKGGLDAMTRALAAEFGPHGITVNGIAPGYFATPSNEAWLADADIAAWLEKRTSLGRWGKPEEIAGAAVFLASPAASYITGQILGVDGGYLAHY